MSDFSAIVISTDLQIVFMKGRLSGMVTIRIGCPSKEMEPSPFNRECRILWVLEDLKETSHFEPHSVIVCRS